MSGRGSLARCCRVGRGFALKRDHVSEITESRRRKVADATQSDIDVRAASAHQG